MPAVDRTKLRREILALLRKGPQGEQEIVDVLEQDSDIIHNTLNMMWITGMIERRGKRARWRYTTRADFEARLARAKLR